MTFVPPTSRLLLPVALALVLLPLPPAAAIAPEGPEAPAADSPRECASAFGVVLACAEGDVEAALSQCAPLPSGSVLCQILVAVAARGSSAAGGGRLDAWTTCAGDGGGDACAYVGGCEWRVQSCAVHAQLPAVVVVPAGGLATACFTVHARSRAALAGPFATATATDEACVTATA